MKQRFLGLLSAVVVAGTAVSGAAPAQAAHSWGDYHWGRTANPFTLKLGDNISGAWEPVGTTSYLQKASTDWSTSAVLDTTVVPGRSDRRCRATSGQAEVCAAKYGFNGWLGLASIWASGNHITQGTVKMNDSYFNTSTYNTPAWRQFVMCQEVGHVFGLDHQDTNFDNTNNGSCLDYTSNPASNVQPNAHDYEQLGLIYSSHPDVTPTVSASSTTGNPSRGNGQAPPPAQDESGPDNPADFGRPAGPKDRYGRDILFVRDAGDGPRLFTWVTWADPGQPGAPGRSR